jgi:hypothetical protein
MWNQRGDEIVKSVAKYCGIRSKWWRLLNESYRSYKRLYK